MNDKQATIEGLKRLGYTAVFPARSKKYTEYSCGEGATYLIGKSGALRKVAEGEPVSSSISLTDSRVRRHIMEIGRFPGEVSVERAQQILHHLRNPSVAAR